MMDAEWLKTQFTVNPDKSKADLARALGLEPPAISKMIGGKRQIKAHEYVAMRRFFGMPTDGARAAAGGVGSESGSSYTLGPLSDMQDSAPAIEQESWVMPAHLFENRTTAPPEQIRIFSVHGDAMMPDFRPDERVLVDLSDTKPAPAGDFVISDGMNHIIRQCEYVPHSDPPQVRISARDGKYAPYVAALDQAAIIGRVIAKLQWL